MCWKQPTRWLGSRDYVLVRERPPFRTPELNLLLEGAGELLIAFRCLGLERTTIVVDAARSFLQAWREDGTVDATGQESRAAEAERASPGQCSCSISSHMAER